MKHRRSCFLSRGRDGQTPMQREARRRTWASVLRELTLLASSDDEVAATPRTLRKAPRTWRWSKHPWKHPMGCKVFCQRVRSLSTLVAWEEFSLVHPRGRSRNHRATADHDDPGPRAEAVGWRSSRLLVDGSAAVRTEKPIPRHAEPCQALAQGLFPMDVLSPETKALAETRHPDDPRPPSEARLLHRQAHPSPRMQPLQLASG